MFVLFLLAYLLYETMTKEAMRSVRVNRRLLPTSTRKSVLVTTLMGDGSQRSLECRGSECEGEATRMSLLAPKSLAVAPDGAVYVADHNLIRRIKADGTVTTILKLK